MKSRHLPFVALFACVLCGAGNASASTTELLQNGGFEADAAYIQSGDPITAWAAFEDGILGGVQVLADSVSPVSGHATVGAASGSYYALLDLAQPSTQILSQSFLLGAQGLAHAQLSLQYFVNYHGTETSFAPAASLDFSTDADNIQFRIDVLHGTAAVDSSNAAELVYSQQFAALPGAGPNAYNSFSANLDPSVLKAGGDYVLRIAAVSNRGQMLVGIDTVSLQVTAVPEAQTWAMLVAGLGLLGVALRRRRA